MYVYVYVYVFVELIKPMLVEEVLDDTEEPRKWLSCAMTASTEREEINKKNRHR